MEKEGNRKGKGLLRLVMSLAILYLVTTMSSAMVVGCFSSVSEAALLSSDMLKAGWIGLVGVGWQSWVTRVYAFTSIQSKYVRNVVGGVYLYGLFISFCYYRTKKVCARTCAQAWIQVCTGLPFATLFKASLSRQTQLEYWSKKLYSLVRPQ